MKVPSKTATILTLAIGLLATVASAGGFFLPGLYRDNLLIRSAWRGNDLATLLVAIPGMVVALLLSLRGSSRAHLIWLGTLAYMLYNYAFYLFGAAFNQFFLLYVAIFTFSILALVFSLPQVPAQELSQAFARRTPVRWVAGYMLVVGLGVGGLWIGMSAGFLWTGKVPQPIVASGHPTGVVFALDLSLMVPGMLLGGLWLFRRRPWGYVLAAIMNVKGAGYTLALAIASLTATRAGIPDAAGQIPFWLSLSLASLVATVLMLGNLKTVR
jgi:hypothetical protein